LRLPTRTRGLPRFQPPPEMNVVQNPQMSRALQRWAGLRQAHVMPAFAEGLQAALQVGELPADPKSQFPRSYAAMKEAVPDGVNVDRQSFVNPPANSTICVLRRLHLYNKTAGQLNEVVYNNIQNIANIAIGATYKTGQTLTEAWNGAGNAPTQSFEPPDVKNSACGIYIPRQDGINGGYLWEGYFSPPGGAVGSDVLEDFNGNRGPRVILWPGSSFTWYVIDAGAAYYSNIWWDEYPLS